MPGTDGTGPAGRGPVTGGAGGYCALILPDDPQTPPMGFVGRRGLATRLTKPLGRLGLGRQHRGRRGPANRGRGPAGR